MKKQTIQILKIKDGKSLPAEDEVALEKHFSVKINGEKMFSLNCTPEFLEELILGRLYTEGMIREKKQVKNILILWEQGEIHVSLNTKITSFSRAGWVFSSERREPGDKDVREQTWKFPGFSGRRMRFLKIRGSFSATQDARIAVPCILRNGQSAGLRMWDATTRWIKQWAGL